MQFYEINIYQVMIFKLYIVYNNHEMLKFGNETREKMPVLSEVLGIILLSTAHLDLTLMPFSYMLYSHATSV